MYVVAAFWPAARYPGLAPHTQPVLTGTGRDLILFRRYGSVFFCRFGIIIFSEAGGGGGSAGWGNTRQCWRCRRRPGKRTPTRSAILHTITQMNSASPLKINTLNLVNKMFFVATNEIFVRINTVWT